MQHPHLLLAPAAGLHHRLQHPLQQHHLPQRWSQAAQQLLWQRQATHLQLRLLAARQQQQQQQLLTCQLELLAVHQQQRQMQPQQSLWLQRGRCSQMKQRGPLLALLRTLSCRPLRLTQRHMSASQQQWHRWM